MTTIYKSNTKNLGSVIQILSDLRRIVTYLSPHKRIQLLILLILQIISGFAEIVSLGALMPFLSAISNAHGLMNNSTVQPLIEFFNIQTEKDLIIYASAGFAAAFTFLNLFKIFVFWLQSKMTVTLGCDISNNFFRQIVYQDFQYHINSNSGDLISRTFNDLNAVLHFISSTMMIITQIISILAIITAILYYNPAVSLGISSTVILLYLIIATLNKKRIVKNGQIVSDSRAVTIKNLQIALGGVRDVMLNNLQEKFIERYSVSDHAFRTASRSTQFLSMLPRYLIEIVGVVTLISVATFYTVSDAGVFGALPFIGALAMATVRILPAAQSVYNSYALMQSVHVSVKRSLDILDLGMTPLTFSPESTIGAITKEISLKDIWFHFDAMDHKTTTAKEPHWILRGVNIEIPANKTVAFVGKTGSGKTTLSDIILGLLSPQKGSLSVDGIDITQDNIANWRQCVASVPQSIFLIDASLKENVAFGVRKEDIDLDKVKQVCKLAQIDDLIQSRPNHYDEIIGENGLKLSGGQRQRLGIARALYKNASLLVFDEATSALDNKTEANVMETISCLHGKHTMLIIAHRLETIKKADLIYEIQNGIIVAQGTYEELLEKSPSFREIALGGHQ